MRDRADLTDAQTLDDNPVGRVILRPGDVMAFYAHSLEGMPQSHWHGLASHLLSTGAGAGTFGALFGADPAARLAGLLHDLGKYNLKFQARLDGSEERVDHSTAGAKIVRKLVSHPDDKIVAELIAYAIAGHHAGLPDRHSASFSCLDERLKAFDDDVLDPAWRTEIEADTSGLMPAFDWAEAEQIPFQLAFLGRMIFSCLVDADFKDTEKFYASASGYLPDRDWPSLGALLPRFRDAFDTHMSGIGHEDTPVNRLRGEILHHVRSRSGNGPGLFTLTVPTGGGKTLASLGFALDHAHVHGLRRIIYAIPFTSIIDQTASIFSTILGKDAILEHHSAIEDERTDRPDAQRDDSARSSGNKLKLAMEDWAAPIVVTTNVQLFESLFAARPSRCRKLHNIANSVIVLDEAQTLPRHLLAPTVRAIDELARNYGCSIVLCTATQPAFDKRTVGEGHALALDLEGRELAPDPPRLAQALRRTVLRHAGALNDEALIEALKSEPQALVIVNSRRHALALYRAANERGLDGLVHLTTRQYAAHRRRVLANIRGALKQKQPCRVIATSLVEAGVDLDFPKVWRAEAGLDQIAQAAGRCNREGRRPPEESIVTIFKAPDNAPPTEIKGLIGDMGRMADRFDDLLSPEAIEAYFQEVYWRAGDQLDAKNILSAFRFHPATGTDFAYREVAARYRMIEDGMAAVIVAKDDKAASEIERAHVPEVPSGAIARQLQPFVVQVPPKERARLIANGHAAFAAPSLRADQFAVLKTEKLYEPDVGLVWERADEALVDGSII